MTEIPPSELEPNGALDPLASSLLAQAARGDLLAQRHIRQAWCDTLHPDQPFAPNADLMAASGLFVARMCAANGDHSDAETLAMLLLNAGVRFHDAGRIVLSAQLIGEAVALYERLAAAGHQDASEVVDKLVAQLPAEVVALAQVYSKPRKEGSDAPTDPQP